MSASSDESVAKSDARRSMRTTVTSTTSRRERTKSNTRQTKSDVVENIPPNKTSSGEYKSFEEKRATSKYFTLVSSETNFNLLQRHEERFAEDIENSCTDMDIASSMDMVAMEEDDDDESSHVTTDENVPPTKGGNNDLNVTTFHDKKAPLNVTTLHGTVCDSVAKKSNPRKVLFDVNTSFGNRSVASNVNNTSTASSVINESEAVGIHDDKEETVNTKFAARELSMMFSSPAAAELYQEMCPLSHIKTMFLSLEKSG